MTSCVKITSLRARANSVRQSSESTSLLRPLIGVFKVEINRVPGSLLGLRRVTSFHKRKSWRSKRRRREIRCSPSANKERILHAWRHQVGRSSVISRLFCGSSKAKYKTWYVVILRRADGQPSKGVLKWDPGVKEWHQTQGSCWICTWMTYIDVHGVQHYRTYMTYNNTTHRIFERSIWIMNIQDIQSHESQHYRTYLIHSNTTLPTHRIFKREKNRGHSSCSPLPLPSVAGSSKVSSSFGYETIYMMCLINLHFWMTAKLNHE